MCLWVDIYTEFSAHKCISWLCQLSGSRDISTPGARSKPNTRCLSWFLILLSNRRNQGSLAIWLIQAVRKHKPQGQATLALQPHMGSSAQPPTSHSHGRDQPDLQAGTGS